MHGFACNVCSKVYNTNILFNDLTENLISERHYESLVYKAFEKLGEPPRGKKAFGKYFIEWEGTKGWPS